MSQYKKIEHVHYRKFAPIDRETPIFEIVVDEQIIMDIAKNEDTDEVEVGFYKDVACKYMTVTLLLEIIEKATSLIKKEEENNH